MTKNFSIGIANDFYTEMRGTEDGPVEVTVEVFVIVASDAQGHVWSLPETHSTNRAQVEADLADLDHDPASKPELWHECDPIYGSEAWDSEAEYGLACFEADCYGEPRPRQW